MDIKRILISTLLIASVTSSTSCSNFWAKKKLLPQTNAASAPMVYAPELNPGVHELISDQDFKAIEDDDPLRFETALSPEEATAGTPVELYDSNGNVLSKMYDDGTNSDRIAGDGIYTCSYTPKPNGETSLSYTAKIGNFETTPTSVRYFDNITDQDVNDMNAVGQKFSEIQSKYLDNKGYVPNDKREEALDEITEYAKELCNSGEAIEYRVNKKHDNVIVKLNSGISCVYANPIEGLSAAPGGNPLQTAVDWAIEIANDDTHGYSQANRNGNPDYDCSSFVIAAMKEGGMNVGGATYTGNMQAQFTANDFDWIDWGILGGKDNLQYGDVLLRTNHTELYIGNGQRVGAHSNYDNNPGDSGGNEISIKTMSDTESWNGVLRYKYSNGSSPSGGSNSNSVSNSSNGNNSNSGFGSSNNTQYQIHNLNVLGFKPHTALTDRLSDTTSLITSEFSPEISADPIVSGSNVAPLSINSFGPDQIIFWRGHGGYDGRIHSFLYTDHPFNITEYSLADIIEDRVLVAYNYITSGSPKVCVTAKYIDAHCSDMTGSYIFLASCYSLKDSVLATSFINKNCNVVVGFTEAVYTSYINNIMYGLTDEMCKKRTSNLTGYPVDYYSIEEALETVKAIYGSSDTELNGGNKTPAQPFIFGNRSYRFAEAIHGTNINPVSPINTNSSLQLASTYVSVGNGGNTAITLIALPSGYTYSDLIWSSENENIASVDQNGNVYGVNSGNTIITVKTNDDLYSQQCVVHISEAQSHRGRTEAIMGNRETYEGAYKVNGNFNYPVSFSSTGCNLITPNVDGGTFVINYNISNGTVLVLDYAGVCTQGIDSVTGNSYVGFDFLPYIGSKLIKMY